VVGYAFLEQGTAPPRKIRVIEYGTIRAKASLPLFQRLAHIAAELRPLIAQHQPVAMAMESAFVQKNVHSALVLGHARGVLMLLGAEAKMELSEFPPRSVKQIVTGNGGATKEQVAWMMQQHLQLTTLPEPLDASDALAIAWAGLNASPQEVAQARGGSAADGASASTPTPAQKQLAAARKALASAPSPLELAQKAAKSRTVQRAGE